MNETTKYLVKGVRSYPPKRSALSLCWFILITTRRWPVLSARYCTAEVLPVPVSPTSNTGSTHATQQATRSSKHAAGRVKAKLSPPAALRSRNMALLQQHSLTSNQEQILYTRNTASVHQILTQGREKEKLRACYNERKFTTVQNTG